MKCRYSNFDPFFFKESAVRQCIFLFAMGFLIVINITIHLQTAITEYVWFLR